MKYYITNKRHKTILRPATSNWHQAVDWAGGMNLFTHDKPFSVQHAGNLKAMLKDGWQIADCVGLFKKTAPEIAAEKQTEEILNLFEAAELRDSEVPF